MAYSQGQRELAYRLRELAERVGATNAFVFDGWGLIWCSAALTFGEEQSRLYAQVKAILEGLSPPLARGTKLDRIFPHDDSPMYCASFAATYVLGLWLGPNTNEFLLRRAVGDALPLIESMTLLRIPDGPGHGFRRHLGSHSGRTWAAVPEHLGNRSDALGHGFRATWAAVPEHLGAAA